MLDSRFAPMRQFSPVPTQGLASKKLPPIDLWLIHSNFVTIDFFGVFDPGLVVDLSTYSNHQILQCSIAFHPPYNRCHKTLPPITRCSSK